MTMLNIKELYNILAQRAKKNHRSLTGEAIEATAKEKQSILQLKGLEKKLWKDVDITKHIAAERQSWE
ncbi:MAG: hypothetical protein LLG04_03595 [Parachlamydia sp.]|nr:hypothetical protein [Parachlamydia sp.]